MASRWRALCAHLGFEDQWAPVYGKLTIAYGEPGRAYHNMAHIRQCLEQFELLRHLTVEPNSVELAIWFHDAVYDSKRKDNEERSAVMLSDVLSNTGLAPEICQRAERLILATKHLGIPVDSDEKIIVDADLSILGMTAAVFDIYEEQIRKEYEWVPICEYIAGRCAVLRHFLDRPQIFQTNDFRGRYEEQARLNLCRSIKRLLPKDAKAGR